MTHLHRLLTRVVADLSGCGARFALIGGIAVSARVEPRFTRDLDFAVAVGDDGEAERIVAAFRGRGYRAEDLFEHEAPDRLATVRFQPPEESELTAFVDLLFASSGIEPEVVAAATVVTLPGTVSVPVARIGHLIALKVVAADADRRPQDFVDLAHLVPAASADELTLAREAVRLVVQRGFGRGKALVEELEAAIARFDRGR